jgi:hypothetical protein
VFRFASASLRSLRFCGRAGVGARSDLAMLEVRLRDGLSGEGARFSRGNGMAIVSLALGVALM